MQKPHISFNKCIYKYLKQTCTILQNALKCSKIIKYLSHFGNIPRKLARNDPTLYTPDRLGYSDLLVNKIGMGAEDFIGFCRKLLSYSKRELCRHPSNVMI